MMSMCHQALGPKSKGNFLFLLKKFNKNLHLKEPFIGLLLFAVSYGPKTTNLLFINFAILSYFMNHGLKYKLSGLLLSSISLTTYSSIDKQGSYAILKTNFQTFSGLFRDIIRTFSRPNISV